MSSTVRIPLHRRYGPPNRFAIVDIEDFHLVAPYRWFEVNGYAKTRVHGGELAMHRLILNLDRWEGLQGDHINRDRADNRRSNLRVCTKAQNSQNLTPFRMKSSRYRGVSWHAQSCKWRAMICSNGKLISLGLFAEETDAAIAAKNARLRLMPHAVD